jgi:hypothetical protein
LLAGSLGVAWSVLTEMHASTTPLSLHHRYSKVFECARYERMKQDYETLSPIQDPTSQQLAERKELKRLLREVSTCLILFEIFELK